MGNQRSRSGGGVVKKFVQDLWTNPYFWLSFAVVIVFRLILR